LFIVHEVLASGSSQGGSAWLIDGLISALAKLPLVQMTHLAGINANAETPK
jgi:hypothetical protein